MRSTVAYLTPPGRSALATLALAGPLAWGAVRLLFHPRQGELPERPEGGRFWLGKMGGDDVVLAVRGAGAAEVVEVHCHGGREVVRLLLERLAERGLAEVGWEDHLRGVGEDALQVGAAVVLANALTVRAAAVALDQCNGALRAALLRVVALIDAGAAGEAAEALAEVVRWGPVGAHLAEPWRVALAGPPNVGKSSLVNALVGHQRSIVAPTPGTTRDVVTVTVALDGWPVELADTAGLRAAGEALEAAGVEQARAFAAAADLRLWVMDPSAAPVPAPGDGVPTLVVVNKVDLPATWAIGEVAGAVAVSAVTGEGVEALCEAIVRRLVPCPPPPGAAVPVGAGVAARLGRALGRLRAGEAGVAAEVRAVVEGPASDKLEGDGPPGSLTENDHAALQSPPGE